MSLFIAVRFDALQYLPDYVTAIVVGVVNMPIYEYRCEACGAQKEHLQKMRTEW